VIVSAIGSPVSTRTRLRTGTCEGLDRVPGHVKVVAIPAERVRCLGTLVGHTCHDTSLLTVGIDDFEALAAGSTVRERVCRDGDGVCPECAAIVGCLTFLAIATCASIVLVVPG